MSRFAGYYSCPFYFSCTTSDGASLPSIKVYNILTDKKKVENEKFSTKLGHYCVNKNVPIARNGIEIATKLDQKLHFDLSHWNGESLQFLYKPKRKSIIVQFGSAKCF